MLSRLSHTRYCITRLSVCIFYLNAVRSLRLRPDRCPAGRRLAAGPDRGVSPLKPSALAPWRWAAVAARWPSASHSAPSWLWLRRIAASLRDSVCQAHVVCGREPLREVAGRAAAMHALQVTAHVRCSGQRAPSRSAARRTGRPSCEQARAGPSARSPPEHTCKQRTLKLGLHHARGGITVAQQTHASAHVSNTPHSTISLANFTHTHTHTHTHATHAHTHTKLGCASRACAAAHGEECELAEGCTSPVAHKGHLVCRRSRHPWRDGTRLVKDCGSAALPHAHPRQLETTGHIPRTPLRLGPAAAVRRSSSCGRTQTAGAPQPRRATPRPRTWRTSCRSLGPSAHSSAGPLAPSTPSLPRARTRAR